MGKRLQNRKRTASDPRNTRVYIGIFVFFAFVVYISGYIYTSMSKPKIGIEIAQQGTIEMPKSFRGIIIRDELVVNSHMSGELIHEYSDKERVKKDSLIATVKNTQNVAVIEEQIAKIDTDILKKQQNRADISLFAADIAFVNDKIKKIINSNISKFNSINMMDMSQFKQSLQKELDRRNNIMFTDTQSSLVGLIDEKTNFENQLSKNVAALTAPAGGIISFNIDGFEDIFTISQLHNFTDEQTKMNIDEASQQLQQSIKESDPAFKIITSNNWYVASYIPSANIEDWSEGILKNIYITGEDYDRTIAMEVFILNKGIKDTYVVLKATKGLIDFIDMRSVEFEIRDNVYEGIKIPNSAIIEKAMLLIPNKFIIKQQDEEGVIKKGEVTDEFIIINKKSVVGENTYVLQDMKTLAVGDIILESNNSGAKSYQLSEVTTVKGVYVVNSSITEFKRIGEVLVSNGDYSITKSNSIFELQVYDRIISDAKSINDSEMVY